MYLYIQNKYQRRLLQALLLRALSTRLALSLAMDVLALRPASVVQELRSLIWLCAGPSLASLISVPARHALLSLCSALGLRELSSRLILPEMIAVLSLV
jgi:hypothetical protein